MGHSKLTQKQDAFSSDIANKKYKHHWLAYEANYNCKGMSQNSIYVETCRLMQNPKVSLRIKEIEDKIKAKEQITLDEILVKLSERCNLDMREMFNDDNSFKNIKELDQEQAMFLSSFEVVELFDWVARTDDKGKSKKERIQIGWVKKVKIESIKDIMDMLIKVHGGYAKDNDQKGNNLEAIRELIYDVRGKK